MYYRIKNKHAEQAFSTSDGRVTHVTPGLQWAVGKSVDAVLAWAKACGYRAYVAQYQGGPEQRIDLDAGLP